MVFFFQVMTLQIVLNLFLFLLFFYSRLTHCRAGFSVWDELIWDQPGPNKQIKIKQITSVWLDVWRDQCVSGQKEIEKSVRFSMEKKKAAHNCILCQKTEHTKCNPLFGKLFHSGRWIKDSQLFLFHGVVVLALSLFRHWFKIMFRLPKYVSRLFFFFFGREKF